ncbi:response regulator [Bacillus gobiensis]|uniref:response regulator n=1 Tax=Bacillus gobiensis TaxID=1441095 RepID=UPI003D24F3C2
MLNVVIAEDDFRIAAIHEKYLSQMEGFALKGKALNAKETIELLSRFKVDLLLLDLYMPDELGTKILPDIRKDYPKTDIIVITAATETALLKDALRSGVFHYLIKPVSSEKFAQVMGEYKKKKQFIDSKTEINQADLDLYFGTQNQEERKSYLPTGINSITLEKVKRVLKGTEEGITAEEIGEKMGVSRTTSRRYVEYLVSLGEAKAELEYGIIGRPERRYYLS